MRPALVLALVAAVGAGSGRAGAAEAVVQGRLAIAAGAVEAQVTIAPGWHVNAHQPAEDYLIPTELTLDAAPGVRFGPVAYPAPQEKRLSFSDTPLLLYEGTIVLRAPILAGQPARVTGRLRYQACNDTTCLPPRTLELATGDEAAAGSAGAAGGAAAGGDPNAVAAFVARWGWPATFAMVFLLGVGLNLTPCVYPLISVTLAYFGGRTGTGGRTVRLAAFYVLGICLTFSTLGAAAALSGSLFGAALQRPEVLGGIAVLMVVLALANFGVWHFRLPSGLVQRANRGGGEGAFGAFFMGLTMGVVGAPCIGPIVAALLLFVGAQQSVPLGLALFFTLGLGLGLPYLVLATVAGGIRRLPRGGDWLAWVEALFGFVLLGLAVHFATPLLPDRVVGIAWAAVFGSAGLVLGLVRPVGGPAVRGALRLAGLAVIAYGIAGAVATDAGGRLAWEPYSEARFAAARTARDPVLIDFQADWCLPCREMERTTFRDRAVVRAAEPFVLLKADVTEQDDTAEALMRRFGVPGVPTYLVFDRSGAEHARFVGLVDAATMAAALERAAAVPAGRG